MGRTAAPAIRRFRTIDPAPELTTNPVLRLLTGDRIAIMVLRSPSGGVDMGAYHERGRRIVASAGATVFR